MKQLKNMYVAVAGLPSEDAANIPDDLTAEKMVDVVKVYFSASIGAARDVVEELLSQVRAHFNRLCYSLYVFLENVSARHEIIEFPQDMCSSSIELGRRVVFEHTT